MTGVDLARDDLALDALAAGLAPPGGDEVLGLLHVFRTGLEPGAVAVPMRRPRRRASLVALSAAAGLVLGGLAAGAVVTADEPGQLFYAAHKAVLGDPTAADRVTTLLDDAAEEIADGDFRAARDRLDKAAERLGDVDDPAERARLRTRLQRLSAVAGGAVAPGETESPDDDSSGKGSGPDDSGSDSSGSGSGGSGSGSSGSGGNSGRGGGSDD